MKPDETFTRVLIAEDIPGDNKGEAALFYGMVESLRALGPARFSLFSVNPDVDSAQYSGAAAVIDARGVVPGHIVSNLGTTAEKAWNYAVFLAKHAGFLLAHKALGKRALSLFRLRPWKAYLESDVVLLSHDSFWAPLYHAPLLAFFRCLDVPAVVYAGTITPPREGSGAAKRKAANWLTRAGLGRAALVLLRERASKAYVESLGLNGSGPPVEVHPDLAFLMPPAPAREIDALFAKEAIPAGRPLVGMAVSDRTLGYAFPGAGSAEERREKALSMMATVVDHVTAELGATVVFVPHSTGPTPNLDDRLVADEIIRRLRTPDHVLNARGDFTPQELKGLANRLAMTFGTRLHFTIDALCGCVPSLLVTHRRDLRCHGIVGDMLGQAEHVRNIEEAEEASLVTTISRLWAEKDSVRRDLEARMPQVVADARRHGRRVAELLAARGGAG